MSRELLSRALGRAAANVAAWTDHAWARDVADDGVVFVAGCDHLAGLAEAREDGQRGPVVRVCGATPADIASALGRAAMLVPA